MCVLSWLECRRITFVSGAASWNASSIGPWCFIVSSLQPDRRRGRGGDALGPRAPTHASAHLQSVACA